MCIINLSQILHLCVLHIVKEFSQTNVIINMADNFYNKVPNCFFLEKDIV